MPVNREVKLLPHEQLFESAMWEILDRGGSIEGDGALVFSYDFAGRLETVIAQNPDDLQRFVQEPDPNNLELSFLHLILPLVQAVPAESRASYVYGLIDRLTDDMDTRAARD